MSDSAPRILIHLGPPKSGTTYLQALLWRNKRALQQEGVFLPGAAQIDHYAIGHDLRGERRRARNMDASVSSLDEAIDAFHRSGCHTTVLSDERLARAQPDAIGRAVSRLAPARVEVVYGVRSLTGLLASQWQERVKNGVDLTFEDWLDSIAAHDPDEPFWRFHDIPRVLDRWSPGWVRPVHVLTVPSRSDDTLLWDRLRSVLGVREQGQLDVPWSNESLGLVEADLLRQIQTRVDDDLTGPRRARILKTMIANQTLAKRAERMPILIPEPARDWIHAENERRRDFLASAPVNLAGDLAELDLDDSRFGSSTLDGHQTDQLDAALDVIARLVREVADATRSPTGTS